ncbi:hypothetical protein J6590_023184 [Homalodisca vitripennis]|nr:hypothetical protein J6590_023184 [Homalodisca vitripennis]
MPTSLPSPQQSALGTQEVPLHTEAPTHGKALSEEGSTSAEEVKSLQDIEDQLLNSPSTPMSTGTLDDVKEQLGNLRMKRPNLTTAQRREALKAKLLEKGEAFDPSKWRRGKKKKKNPERQEVSTPGPTAGTKAGEGSAKRPRGTLVTPPSAEGPAKKARRETQKPEAHDPEASGSTPKATYREVAAIKMAIALEGYPEAKLSAEQGEAIEDAIMEEIQPLEDGSVPSFAGTYPEKGVLIASCINEHTKRWLEEVIQRIKPLGDDISLRVGLRKDILRSTRVFFRAHPKLLKKTPEKPDPKGYGFVCFLDEVCYKAVKASNCRANLGLWQSRTMPRVLQINLQHSRAASAAFCQFFLQEGFDLALIQEPWLHQGRVAGLNQTKERLGFSNPQRILLERSHCGHTDLEEWRHSAEHNCRLRILAI